MSTQMVVRMSPTWSSLKDGCINELTPCVTRKPPSLKPKSSIKFHLLATGTDFPNEALVESDAITDLKQTPQLHPLAMGNRASSRKFRRDSNVSYNPKQGQANFHNKEAERNAQSNRTKSVVCMLLRVVLCLSPSNSLSLRTVATIVIAHTFCASRDLTQISYRRCLLIQGYFCAVQNYAEKVELSKCSWYPKRKLEVTTHFSEIV